MTRRTAAVSTLALVALLTGCSVNPDPAFRDVQQMVGSRTGGKRLHWKRGGAGDAEAQRTVQSLLRRNLTADRAVQVALLNNRSIQANFEELGIAQADYVQALLPSNPNFSGYLRYPDRPPHSANIEGQLTANVLDLLLLPVRRKIAAQQLRTAKLRVASEVLEIVSETKAAFYTLQARQQLLKRLELIANTNKAGLDITQHRHEAGNITDLDLANQQALYSQSRVDIAQTRMQIRSDRERLNRLMGIWEAPTQWRVADQLPAIPKSEVSLTNLEKRAVAERLDVALARQNAESIAYALRARGATRFLPANVNIGVNREKETDGQVLTGPTLDMQLPLFDFGQAAIPKLQSQYRQAQHSLEALAVNARSEVREARDLVVANRDLAKFYDKTLLPQRLQIVNQTQLQYNAMQVGPLELLAAKERELTTERAYIEAWRDYWIARVELERALIGSAGGGSARVAARTRSSLGNLSRGEAAGEEAGSRRQGERNDTAPESAGG